VMITPQQYGAAQYGPSFLLQTEKNENFPLTVRQRLECLPDECSRPMDLHAAEVYGLGEHGHAGFIAGDEQVSDGDGMPCGIDGITPLLSQPLVSASLSSAAGIEAFTAVSA